MAYRTGGMVTTGVTNMLRLFQLSRNELAIYSVLARKPMTIRQLQKNTNLSERSLRTHLDDLVRRHFVVRKLVEGKHLKYMYYANSGETLLALIKRQIEDVEKGRLRRKAAILEGTEHHIGH